MVLDTLVVDALGAERSAALTSAVKQLLELADSVPKTTIAVAHLPIPLRSETAKGAAAELANLVRRHDPDGHWDLATTIAPGGHRNGFASPFLPPGFPGSQRWFTRFVLSDLHTRLSATWLTQLWRAAELAMASHDAIARWQIIAAAACSRSLLEGAAVFAVTSRAILTEWDLFKRLGEPTLQSLSDYASMLKNHLAKLQYASRVGQQKDKPPPLRSTNILGDVGRFAKVERGRDVIEMYEWLCDAVHPSFGSSTTYLVFRGRDDAKTHLLERYARRPLAGLAETGFALHPTVAFAAADAVVVAGNALFRDLTQVQWLIDDFGFTSQVAFHLQLDYYGRNKMPKPNERCPCGSGRKFKACFHRWGLAGLPPEPRKA